MLRVSRVKVQILCVIILHMVSAQDIESTTKGTTSMSSVTKADDIPSTTTWPRFFATRPQMFPKTTEAPRWLYTYSCWSEVSGRKSMLTNCEYTTSAGEANLDEDAIRKKIGCCYTYSGIYYGSITSITCASSRRSCYFSSFRSVYDFTASDSTTAKPDYDSSNSGGSGSSSSSSSSGAAIGGGVGGGSFFLIICCCIPICKKKRGSNHQSAVIVSPPRRNTAASGKNTTSHSNNYSASTPSAIPISYTATASAPHTEPPSYSTAMAEFPAPLPIESSPSQATGSNPHTAVELGNDEMMKQDSSAGKVTMS